MLPGHGLSDGALSSLVLDGSPACKLFTALELERAPSGKPCLMGRGVNPTVHSQMTPTAPNYMNFGVWCSCNKETLLQKNWSENTLWLVSCRFFGLRKSSKRGAKMGQKLTPSKPGFQHPISISDVIEVCWWCFGGKKTCGWVVLRAYVCCLCQNRPKTEAEHPGHQGRPFHPKFYL